MKRPLTFLFILSYFLSFSQSNGGITSGTTSYCDDSNSGFISLTGYNGTILHWESSTDNISWTNIGNPTPTQSYLNLSITTHYRAIVQDGAFPQDTSTVSTITIHVPSVAGTANGGGTFCFESGAGTINLTGTTGNVIEWIYSTNNGSTWTNVPGTSPTINHPSITIPTIYAAVVENVPGCPYDTSSYAEFILDDFSNAGTLGIDDTLCHNQNQDTLQVSGYNGIIQDWISSTDNGITWGSLGQTNDSYTINNLLETTLYKVITVNGVCPADSSNIIELTVVQPTLVSAGSDQSITRFETTQLIGSGNGSVSWSPTTGLDAPQSLTPEAAPTSSTWYTITLTDNNGCTSNDSVFVHVTVPVPSAFTPNEDGVNDFFVIEKLENLPSNSLVVYNRIGNVVFEASPYQNDWDGTAQNGKNLPDGMYYYLLDLGEESPYSGYILLKR